MQGKQLSANKINQKMNKKSSASATTYWYWCAGNWTEGMHD
jgi:hypothetical protein